jgi:hypothetical protein
MTEMQKLEVHDRVLVVVDGKITEVRVAEVSGFAVKVTRQKGDEGLVYERDQIFPLYRKTKSVVKHPVLGEVDVREITPLFEIK